MTEKMTLYMETTKKEPEQTLAEIQKLLKDYGIRDMLISYDNDGNISGVSFMIRTDCGDLPFKLPVNHKGLWNMAKAGKTKYIRDEEQARRVAWRQVYRWIEAQIALVNTAMVKIEQIFLPYLLIDKKNTTIYDKFLEDGFKLLGTGRKRDNNESKV